LPRAVSVFSTRGKHEEEDTKTAKYGIEFHRCMHEPEKVMLPMRPNGGKQYL
jgi:hypothetical protein